MEAQIRNTNKKLLGPPTKQLLAIGLMLQARPLETYEFIHKTYGDIVWMPWLNRETLFLYHPDYVLHVLKNHHTNYVKSDQYEHLKPLLGEGLLTSEGELWRSERRIMAKEFHPESINAYVGSVKRITEDSLADLPLKDEEKEMDIAPYFSRLTFQIAGEIFFGASVDQFSSEVNDSLNTQLDIVSKRMRRSWNIPLALPTSENLRARKSGGHLNSVVADIMKEKSTSERPHNVLSKLKGATPPIPLNLIRDEVMTLLLAGHETTSNALMWTTYFLGLHTEWQIKIRDELKSLGKKAEDLERLDLASLPLLKAILFESMRLMPPIPVIARKCIKEDVIAGLEIPAGTDVVCQQWITHRDERFWPEPLRFSPLRFINREIKRDDFSYFPFAKGPRACIGEELSIVEAMMVLARFTQDYEWKMKENFSPVPVHHLTLKSENGMWINVKRVS